MQDLKDFTIDSATDLKAKEIVSLDVSGVSNVTDYMVVCSGTSTTHVRSIAENLIVKAKAANIKIIGVEGKDVGEWILVDLGDVIFHVMTSEIREFYQLEKLWSDIK